MKLHLPKALFTAVMAVFALSQTTYAETFNLLESGDNWQMTGRSPLPTYNAETDTIAAGDGWKQSLATYTMPSIEGRRILGYTLTDKVDGVEGSGSLTFQFTCAQTNGASNSVLSIALVGSEQVLALGTMAYGTGALGYGVSSDVSKDVYHNGDNWDNNSRGGVAFTQFTDAEGNAVNRTTGTYTYTGVVTQDANGDYLLNLTVSLVNGENETTTQYLTDYNLGDSFSINRIAFGSDGSNAKLSNLTVTGQYLEVPVYATVLGAGSSALSSAEWTTNGTGVSYGDIAVTNGADTVVLDITGAAEGSTAQLDADTNVYAIDISGGLVTLTSSGSVTTKELVVKSGASATIATEMTADSVAGTVTIADGGKLTTGNVSGSLSIEKDGELAYTASNLGFLTSTTGTGAISVATETEILQGVVSDFAGTIDVANNQTLYFGSKADSGQDKGTIDLSEATIQLNGGSTMRVQGKQSQLGKLVALDNATLRMYDGNEVNNAYLTEYTITIGEVSIAAGKTLSVEKNWEGHLNIAALNADGKLDMNHGGKVVATIQSITKSGAIDNAGQTTLGISGDSVLNLGGDVTNTGTLVIKGQLAGESTISGGTINVESTASVTGDITFGSGITLGGTLQNSGSLTLGGNVSVSDKAVLTINEDAAVTYSTNDGKDGYIASAQYYVVQGTDSATSSLTGTSVLTSGGVELGTITQSADGKSLVADVALDAPGGIWHVNTQDFTIDGTETNLAKDATGYKVAAGKTLTIAANQNDTMTATKIFSETTGAGNIKLTTDVAMSGAAQATGKLTVSGATLTVNLGNSIAGRDTDHSYLTSFDSIDLNGATILYHGSNTTMNNVTVGADGATLRIKDMGADRVVTLGKTTTLTGDFTIESRGWDGTPDGLKSWKYAVNIEALTGAGGLIVKGNNSSQGETNKVTVGLLDTYTGTITVDRPTSGTTTLIATADGDINLSGLNVSGGANVDLSGVTGTKNLGAVSVGANTTLDLQGTIGDMVATGDGTISLADGTAFTGTASIANGLTLAGTITNSGNLTLTGGLTASSLEVFDAAGESAISYANGDVEGNGYLNTALTIVQSAADSSQLTANGLTLTVAGTAYNLSQNGKDLQLIISGDGGNYFVNNTQDYAAGTKIADAATTGIVMNGGTLNLNTALADGISISTAAAGSVINVADGVTLANSSVTAGSTKSTINGGKNAVFDLGTGLNGAMSSVVFNVNYGEQWEGITQITNSHIGENRLDNLCGGGKGTLKLVGLSGWLVRGQTVQADILLENYSNTIDGVTTTKSAFVFDDNSEDNYTFAGDISGSGDFQVASKSGSWAKLNFTGSTENWTGGIVVTNAYKYNNDTEKNATNEVTINLTHGGDIFSAKGNNGIVMDRASTNDGNNIVNLNIGNANTTSTMNGAISMGDNAGDRAQLKLTVKGDTTFKNEVEVTSLTVDANKTATLEAATTTDALTTNGTIKVTGNGSLTYGGTTTVWAPYTGYNTEAAAATITSNAITGGSVTINNDEDVTESRVISDSAISKYGEGTANVAVGDTNAAVWVEEGNLAMTAANGSTSLAEMTIAAGSHVSTTGDLTVTDALTIIGDAATPALSVTGALTLAGAEINLTNLTLQEGVTSYTLGTVTTGDIDTTGVSLKFGADQLAAAGFEGYTATVGASATDATALVLTLTAPEQPGEPDPGLTTLTEITINGGKYENNVLTFTTNADLTNKAFGDKLNAIMSDEVWAQVEIVGATTLPEEVLVSFKDAAGAIIDFDNGSTIPTITINGEGTKGSQVLTGEGTIVGNYVTAYIPEPTTTTLSLLALAGLAVRRRRK